jgi:integrase/recombinase XerD
MGSATRRGSYRYRAITPFKTAHPGPAAYTPRARGHWCATPVLSSSPRCWPGMDVSTVVGLRDRAIIAVMTYTFARVGAVVALAVEDYFPQKKRWSLRLYEKNGKLNEMPCHHKLERISGRTYQRGGPARRPQGPLFPSANRRDGATLRKADTPRGCVGHGAPPCFGMRDLGPP